MHLYWLLLLPPPTTIMIATTSSYKSIPSKNVAFKTANISAATLATQTPLLSINPRGCDRVMSNSKIMTIEEFLIHKTRVTLTPFKCVDFGMIDERTAKSVERSRMCMM